MDISKWDFLWLPDLNHLEFSKSLAKYLNLDIYSSDNIDFELEELGYIKLSGGRWLFNFDIPTKEQLELIIKCETEKYKNFRVYFKNKFIGCTRSKIK